MAKEDPRMVFVTKNDDGGYSANVSPEVTKADDIEKLTNFIDQYRHDMMDAAQAKFEDKGEGRGEGRGGGGGGGGTPGGSSNAKKSRKSYRKKRRKSYRRK